MDNNAHKEQWVNDVLESTRGLQKAAPAGGLYDRISRRLGEQRPGNVRTFPVGRWAAAAILLVLLNAATIAWFMGSRQPAIADSAPVSLDIPATSTYNY